MSGIATGTAIAISAGVGGATSIAGGLMGASAAGNAADKQYQATVDAARIQAEQAQKALDFQKSEYATQQKNIAPWLKAGTSAVNTLSGMVQNGGFPDWTGSFTAPTGITEQNDPGFQARLQFGQQAMERSAAAKGGLLTGGTARAEGQAAQDYASNEYSNVYGRAFNEYSTKYNEFQNNNTNKFNRLAALSGVGQTATSQLGQFGANASTNISNLYSNLGSQLGNDAIAGGNARASGYINSANAWNGAMSGVNNSLSSYLLMKNLFPSSTAAPSSGGGGMSFYG